jgi:hypothetical protein
LSKNSSKSNDPVLTVSIGEANGVFEASVTVSPPNQTWRFQGNVAIRIYESELEKLRRLSECIHPDSDGCAEAVDAWQRTYWQIRDRIAAENE